jgi:hypothetical protein
MLVLRNYSSFSGMLNANLEEDEMVNGRCLNFEGCAYSNLRSWSWRFFLTNLLLDQEQEGKYKLH